MRSNAKRHLRTHGIFPSAEHGGASPSQYTVGFDTPVVSDVHEAGRLPPRLRWVPPSLSSRTNAESLPRTGAGVGAGVGVGSGMGMGAGVGAGGAAEAGDGGSGSDSEDEYFQSCPLLPVPLPPVTPSWGPEDAYEERNSYEHAERAPYISSQVSRRLRSRPCHLLLPLRPLRRQLRLRRQPRLHARVHA